MKQSARKEYLAALGIETWALRSTAEGAQREDGADWAELRARVAVCTRCSLSATRTQTVFGVGNLEAEWLIVGEAPGAEEDRRGEPFVGRAGQLLNSMLRAIGLAREQVYIANVLKCRPPGNRDPLPEEISACRPYLDQQVDLIGPRVVLTLGNFATRALLGTTEGISRLRGRSYPFGGRDAVLVPTFHPAAALRGGGEVMAKMRADFVRARQSLERGGSRGHP